jgi:hypothetical protein
VMYVERVNGAPTSDPFLAALRCPCGCDFVFKLPLQRFHTRPQWTLTWAGDVPTPHPSIVHTAGCRSHFWVTAGRVVWC